MFTTRISTVRLSTALDAPMRTVPIDSAADRPPKGKRKPPRPKGSPPGNLDRISNEKGGPTGFIVIRLAEAGNLRDADGIDTLVVTDPLTWAETDIPGEGHYCFVGILDHPADLAVAHGLGRVPRVHPQPEQRNLAQFQCDRRRF